MVDGRCEYSMVFSYFNNMFIYEYISISQQFPNIDRRNLHPSYCSLFGNSFSSSCLALLYVSLTRQRSRKRRESVYAGFMRDVKIHVGRYTGFFGRWSIDDFSLLILRFWVFVLGLAG